MQDIAMPKSAITRRAAWIAKDMLRLPQRWLTHLSVTEVQELECAAQGVIQSGIPLREVCQQNFELPTLGPKLLNLSDTLMNGIGFEVIRGLPVAQYSQKMAAIIFCGIGCHIGRARSQNAEGDLLGHVRNTGASSQDINSRIYQTAERQTFHTDSADVVGLLCLKTAKIGGKSLLVSTESIFNKMQAERPDLLALLFEPIATDRRGETPVGEKPYFEIPVFNWYQGKLTGMYQRQYIDSAQRFASAKRLTALHVEALDYFDALANDPQLHIAMQLQAGDIQFVYNHALLHDREAFTDWPEQENRRHLLRLWLSLENDRPLPKCFTQRYGSVEIGNRGGIVISHSKDL